MILTWYNSDTRALSEVESSAWCTVHGLVPQDELCGVVGHSQRALAWNTQYEAI